MQSQTPLQKLGEKVGPSTLDHAAYLVRTSMWASAVAFFTEMLGWKVVREFGNIKELGWRAIFLAPRVGDSVIIQLTEYNDWPDTPVTFEGAHLGIKVENAEQAAAEIQYHYLYKAGLACEIKKVDDAGHKWFVVIPELFTFALELITSGNIPERDLVDAQRAAFNWQDAARDDAIVPALP